MKPAARREVVRHWRAAFGLSQARACGLIGMHRSTFRYRPRPVADEALARRLRALAEERPRFGYRRLHVLLRREGFPVNHKKTYRLYREGSLAIRRKKRKRVAVVPRTPKPVPERANERWSMDFVHDTLFEGTVFRVLTIVDDHSRVCPGLEVARSISGERVGQVLDRIAAEQGYPEVLVTDNGPEFTSRALDEWAYRRGVRLHFEPPRVSWRLGHLSPAPRGHLTPSVTGDPRRDARSRTPARGQARRADGKPGSVPAGGCPLAGGAHSSRRRIAAPLERSHPDAGPEGRERAAPCGIPIQACTRRGLPRRRSPGCRAWALTPRFHPYRVLHRPSSRTAGFVGPGGIVSVALSHRGGLAPSGPCLT